MLSGTSVGEDRRRRAWMWAWVAIMWGLTLGAHSIGSNFLPNDLQRCLVRWKACGRAGAGADSIFSQRRPTIFLAECF